MKKVRFESPLKAVKMIDSECHSPRPFIEKQVKSAPPLNYLENRPITFTNDPVQRFECSNSLPYPTINKTYLPCTRNLKSNSCFPSNELDLSILDCHYDPRNTYTRQNLVHSNDYKVTSNSNLKDNSTCENSSSRILAPIDNKNSISPPNILNKNNDFFIRKDNLHDFKQLHSQFNALHLDKENNPLLKKTEIMKLGIPDLPTVNTDSIKSNDLFGITHVCACHQCANVFNAQHNVRKLPNEEVIEQFIPKHNYKVCPCSGTPNKIYASCSCYCQPMKKIVSVCSCNKPSTAYMPQNAVDKKNWSIEKYEQNKKSACLEVETQNKVPKEKREPTVADLFKIIKLQNEQLQLLQEKVDKFISVNEMYEPQKITQPIHNYVEECVEVKSIGTDEKISIGVMTSFEMFRTSTVINKEIVKKSEAQIQCNRSQVSIKEIISTTPVNLNFLDGITPVLKQTEPQMSSTSEHQVNDLTKNTDILVDKTINEMSLYNVQVDNPITPLMSPEQSLYLDVRDYSDSDSSSDDNVGWTYYNKVMTHVNGMLQESDMPSSASALYRNCQKRVQVQIDNTNVSVAKRVTFGDQPLGSYEPRIQVPTTDTSLKMNQLAAKYLKNLPLTSKTPSPKPINVPVDMSLATRNYMEKHRLLQGTHHYKNGQQMGEMPKFLDITALKQQPKFL